ncbi:M43 family zinc metalloprotease [Rubrivirga sp. S365]|uniref:M43 family zinc metalloprotease n=1 Tax=Rubrivirga sp. S365 TaxID=3076080 RepID=UPI0028CB1033|nr:M43 family zinc metalloprotease [Rubrivirga sp. S365]MDT7857687.1 M43 family zinc metalloprotease [Rubrivirga sp. S365]
MVLRPALLAVVALGAVAVGPGGAAQTAEGNGRRCGVENPPPAQVERTTQIVQRRRALGALRPALRAVEGPVVVPLAVHVVSDGGGAVVTDAQVAAQVDVLNAAFGGLGFQFVLATLDWTENEDWGRGLRLRSSAEREMKRALALDPTVYLNLYVPATLAEDYLGWATLPDERDAGTPLDGVVVGGRAFPGGAAVPFNEGDTAVHEVGHWAGLLHTFDGACSAPNDGVVDTPWERFGATGCPVGRDTCRPEDEGPDGQPLGAAAEGLDPIQNYMDYSDDACMTEFTPGQRDRARALTAEFRPAVAAGGRVVATVARSAFRGAFVGVPQTAPLRVVNTASEPVTITAVRSSDPAFAVGGVGTVVPAAGVAVLDLVFTPAAAGAAGATITVETDRPALAVVPATVTAAASLPPIARVGTEPVRVVALEGERVEVAVELVNEGGAALTYSVGAAPPWVAAVEPAEGTLAPGGAAGLVVTVSTEGLDVPAGQREREVAGALSIATNDPLRPAVEVPLVAVVSERPDAFAVGNPYPNPGRGRITVPLAFPDDADGVTVEVYDALGRRVAVLAEGAAFAAGFRDLVWDAAGAPSGVYLVQARSAGGADVGRVVVAR